MNNLQKLQNAKKQYDELESIRLKASDLLVSGKYDVCVHLHYEKKIIISCATKNDIDYVWASFELIDGELNVTNRGNYTDAEIEGMLIFLEEWIDG